MSCCCSAHTRVHFFVIPGPPKAEPGIQRLCSIQIKSKELDSGFRRNDEHWSFGGAGAQRS